MVQTITSPRFQQTWYKQNNRSVSQKIRSETTIRYSFHSPNTIIMERQKSNTYTFAKLLKKCQHGILELCMRQTTIKWTNLPGIQRRRKSSGHDERVRGILRAANVVTPGSQGLSWPQEKSQSVAGDITSNTRCKTSCPQEVIDFLWANLHYMETGFIPGHDEDVHVPPARLSNVNTTHGNVVLNLTDTHRQMDHSHRTWINSEGNSMLDNPGKIVCTMMNWYDVSVTTDEVTNIPHIQELDQTAPLVASLLAFSERKNIILTLGTKLFAQILSCKDADANPILIVAEATKHARETNDTEMPYYQQITVLMLLVQDEPHVIIPGSKTNQNLHLGKMIQTKDYSHQPFEKYMQVNVNEKLVPISNSTTRAPERKLKFISYYNTARATA